MHWNEVNSLFKRKQKDSYDGDVSQEQEGRDKDNRYSSSSHCDNKVSRVSLLPEDIPTNTGPLLYWKSVKTKIKKTEVTKQYLTTQLLQSW